MAEPKMVSESLCLVKSNRPLMEAGSTGWGRPVQFLDICHAGGPSAWRCSRAAGTQVMAGDADSEAIFTWDSRSHVAARDCQIPECRERRDQRIGS